MSSSGDFVFSVKSFTELKVHLVKNLQQLFKLCLCCFGVMCLAFQAHATNPAPANSATSSPAPAPAAAAPAA